MQVRTVTKDFLFSNDCTLEMLTEIALHKDFVGVSQEYVAKLAKQELSNGSTRKGSKSQASGDMPYAKLRTVLVQKLQDSPTVGEVFKAGTMEFEFNCLPDLDMGNAGKNTAKQGTRAPSSKLSGPYRVAKKGLKATDQSDPDKMQIWQHIWACNSFEEYFAKCPPKGHTKTGRPITASSEMRWAVKCGWIVPTGNEQQ